MPREVSGRMLWLAPPVLFTLGLGQGWIENDDKPDSPSDSGRLFLDARVGYPVNRDVTVGLRMRGSHASVYDYENFTPMSSDAFHLSTLDTGAFVDLAIGRWVVGMVWFGAHASHVHRTASRYTIDDTLAEREEEDLYAGPALSGGLSLGINPYSRGRYRVTVFVETQFSRFVFVSDRAKMRGYSHDVRSLGVAVRF